LFDEKQIFIADIRSFLDTVWTEATTQAEIATSYQMITTPDPHAFLLVV
jgi:hypothetical protein